VQSAARGGHRHASLACSWHGPKLNGNSLPAARRHRCASMATQAGRADTKAGRHHSGILCSGSGQRQARGPGAAALTGGVPVDALGPAGGEEQDEALVAAQPDGRVGRGGHVPEERHRAGGGRGPGGGPGRWRRPWRGPGRPGIDLWGPGGPGQGRHGGAGARHSDSQPHAQPSVRGGGVGACQRGVRGLCRSLVSEQQWTSCSRRPGAPDGGDACTLAGPPAVHVAPEVHGARPLRAPFVVHRAEAGLEQLPAGRGGQVAVACSGTAA
jgi:hypothetical protein